jgi:hypothetical protein
LRSTFLYNYNHEWESVNEVRSEIRAGRTGGIGRGIDFTDD